MVYLHEFSSAFIERTKEIASYLNWFDLIVIIVVIRTSYIGLRKGLLIEIVKFFGLGIGIFAAVTKYRPWGVVLSERTVLSLRWAEITAFIGIFAIVRVAFFLLRFLFVKGAGAGVRGAWNQIGGGALGFCRGCLWMLFLEAVVLCLSPTTGYLAQSIQERSFFGPPLLTGGKYTYQITNQASTSFAIEKFEENLRK